MKKILFALALIAISFGSMSDAAADKKMKGAVRIDGSSTVYPISEAVAEEFNAQFPRIRVTIGVSGTGGGLKKFTVGETDINNASRPIKGKEISKAADLRFVIAVLKVNNDLERMGDLACNIAKRCRHALMRPEAPKLVDFDALGEKVLGMVHASLEALVHQDAAMAREVCRMDEEVDKVHRANYELLKRRMREDPDVVEDAVNALTVSRSLERIADLATNVAEDIVFMVDGDVIRHQADGH